MTTLSPCAWNRSCYSLKPAQPGWLYGSLPTLRVMTCNGTGKYEGVTGRRSAFATKKEVIEYLEKLMDIGFQLTPYWFKTGGF